MKLNCHGPDFVRVAADQLWQAEMVGEAIAPLTLESPNVSTDVAYQIQSHNVARRLNLGDTIVGHKIGLTSEPMQRLLGIHEPDYGHLFSSMWYDSGAAIETPLLQPKVEPEIAFVLKADLAGPNVTMHDVLRATDYVAPAIEVVDSRIRDWRIQLVDTIADNASSGCFIIGSKLTRITDVDLTTLGVVMKVDGAIVETGTGAAVLGHPALAVAWLARKLSHYDTVLKSGQVVLSGAITAAVSVKAGSHAAVSFGRFGHVEAHFASRR